MSDRGQTSLGRVRGLACLISTEYVGSNPTPATNVGYWNFSILISFFHKPVPHAKIKRNEKNKGITMSELKCPFCGQELKNITFMWFCENESCRAYDWTMEQSAWQELIRTRKALDVAKDKLDTVRQYHRGTAVIRPDDIAAYCDRAIEQITALEQKD